MIFEITDKSGRKINLSKEGRRHIRKKHPEVEEEEQIKETIENPDKITSYGFDKTIHYYYKFYKHRKQPSKYLLVIVKYLNNSGYVISSYFETYIK
ncbi:MAG: hypothetical protein ABIJ14_02585 [Nanoarchaeota archaeon]|nr:hypothetical protein [Nanoarchaeota archaeon]